MQEEMACAQGQPRGRGRSRLRKRRREARMAVKILKFKKLVVNIHVEKEKDAATHSLVQRAYLVAAMLGIQERLGKQRINTGRGRREGWWVVMKPYTHTHTHTNE